MDTWMEVIGAWALIALLLGVGWGMACAPGWEVPTDWRRWIASVVLALAAGCVWLAVRLADAVLAWPAESAPALDRWLSSRAQGISNMIVVGAALAAVEVIVWAVAWLRSPGPAASAPQPVPQPAPAPQPAPQPAPRSPRWSAATQTPIPVPANYRRPRRRPPLK